MAHAAAIALADIVFAPHVAGTSIWVNPHAIRRGDSTPRYAACIGALTIWNYITRHEAYSMASGVVAKAPRADFAWALECGDIRLVPMHDASVRRARLVDHATELIARKCDHFS